MAGPTFLHNRSIHLFSYVIAAIHSLFAASSAYAQEKAVHHDDLETDTGYVRSYDQEITSRIYLSQKYTSLKIPGSSKAASFRYRPNTTLNLGIGATYRSFSLNLAYGIPGLNGDGSQRGNTRYLDLQAHIYGRKVVADFFGQFYKGYYLSPKDYISGYEGFYIRPDMRIRMVGGAVYYIFNHSRFSYRSGLIQNEWQTRSAGTFLAGAEFYYGVVGSDSTIIPAALQAEFAQSNVGRLRFINIGPGLGYAYTFVYQTNWFATASLTVSFPLSFVKEESSLTDKNKTGITPNLLGRIAIGYNSRRWIYSASVVQSSVSAKGSYSSGLYVIRTGNYRLNISRRFTLSKKGRKIMKPVDRLFEAPGQIIK